MIIISIREGIRAVPSSIREASFALGATKWQTVRQQVIPAAMGNILTGTTLAMSRAVGETAPLITIGALTYIAFLPQMSLKGLVDPFTVLPIQIFNWVSRPQKGFATDAAAGIVVLLFITLLMNGAAIFLRHRFQKRVRW
jgi:phosphate transport system permease protein